MNYGNLPKTLFSARIPVMATYNSAEIELFGMPMDIVDGTRKKADVSQLTTVMINIDRMIDIYSNGYSIQLVNHDDISKVYNILEEYLTSINQLISHSPNSMRIQDERVNEIDKFAHEVFGLNRHTIIKKSIVVNNAFNIGFTPMGYSNPLIPVPVNYNSNQRMGVLSGYDDNLNNGIDSINPNTFIVQNQPEIDFDKIKRTPHTKYMTLSYDD